MFIPEAWAEVPGFPDYAVSNYGYIRNTRLNHNLRPSVDSYGYQRVTLSKEGKAYYRFVHQIVAQTFLTGWLPGIHVKHLDGNRGNNHIANLRFRGRRLGQLVKNYKAPIFRRVKNEQLDIIHRNAADAAKYINGDVSAVYKVLRGERPFHKGCTFVYVEES